MKKLILLDENNINVYRNITNGSIGGLIFEDSKSNLRIEKNSIKELCNVLENIYDSKTLCCIILGLNFGIDFSEAENYYNLLHDNHFDDKKILKISIYDEYFNRYDDCNSYLELVEILSYDFEEDEEFTEKMLLLSKQPKDEIKNQLTLDGWLCGYGVAIGIII